MNSKPSDSGRQTRENREDILLAAVPVGGVIYFLGNVVPSNYREMGNSLLKSECPSLVGIFEFAGQDPNNEYIELENLDPPPTDSGTGTGVGKWIIRIE